MLDIESILSEDVVGDESTPEAPKQDIVDILGPVSQQDELLYDLAGVSYRPAPTPSVPPPEEKPAGPVYPKDWMPDEETEFKEWYKNWATEAGIDPNPDDPRHHYDYRSAYRAGAFPEIQEDGLYHWPSQFKADDHPNRYVGGMDTKTNKPVGAPQLPLDKSEEEVSYLTGGALAEQSLGKSIEGLMPKIFGGGDTGDLPFGAESFEQFGRLALRAFPQMHKAWNDLLYLAPLSHKEETLGERGKREITAGGVEAATPPGAVDDPRVIAELLAKEPEIRENIRLVQEYFPEVLDRPNASIAEQILTAPAGFLAPMAVSAMSGGAGFLLTFLTSYGNAMEQFETQGVEESRAREAALFTAATTTPIEFMGNMVQIGAIKNALRFAKGPIKPEAISLLEAVAQSAISEGTEEFLQQYFEIAGAYYAANPGMEPREIADYIFSTFDKQTLEALKAGAIGAASGAMLTGAVVSGGKALENYKIYKDELKQDKLTSNLEKLLKLPEGTIKRAAQEGKTIQQIFEEQQPSEVQKPAAEEGVLKAMGAIPGEAAEVPAKAPAEPEAEPEEAIPVEVFKDLSEAQRVGTEATDEEVERWREARQELMDEAEFYKSTGKHKESMKALVEANKYARAIEASEQPERYAEVTEVPQEGAIPTEPSVAKDYAAARNQAQPKQNIVVQPQDKPGRVAMGQFSTYLLNPATEEDLSAPYFDKLYDVREGFVRPGDFWELPTWTTHAAKSLTDSDLMVIRDPDTAADQITKSGYEAVLFSALDVNKKYIKQIAEKVGAGVRIVVGGYVPKSYFKDNPNVEFYDSLDEGVKALGYKPTPGVSTKHFQGTETIPRLCMSKGCLHKCAFCSIPKGVKAESDESIDIQVENMKGLKFNLVYLDDKTFGQAENYAKLPDIAAKIKDVNPDFQGFVIQTTAPQLLKMDDQFLHYGKIKYVELGVETYNDDILARIHKPARTKTIDAAVEKLRANKVAFIPNILVGLPGESKESYLKTLRFLQRNEDIISHVNIYNLALYAGTELGDQLQAQAEIDVDENKVERSYMKNPKLHRSFYNAVLRYAERQLDKTPYTEVLIGQAELVPQMKIFKEKKKVERKEAKKLVEPEGDVIADTGEGVQKAVALTPELEEALKKNNVGVGAGRHRKNFIVSVSEGSGLIYGPARTTDEKTTRTKDFLTGKQTITEYWRKIGGKTFKVLNTPIMPTTKEPKVKLLDKLVNDYKKELGWYTNWREQMTKLQADKYSENDIDKMMKIQTILSAGTSPAVAQTLFGRVMKVLETGGTLHGGKGSGMPGPFAEKIMRVWKGEDTDIQTLEQFQQSYGPKIGAMMYAALHPGTKEGSVVVDRHIARMWGYNALWGGSFRIPKHLQQEIVTDITETAKRFDMPVPAIQAALWYATGAGHWGSATHFEEAIRLNPAKTLSRGMLNLITLEPQAITSFRGKLYYSIRGAQAPQPLTESETERLKALVQKSKEMKLFGDPLSEAEKLEFLNLRHKQEGDKPSPWSRNDVVKRMEASTETNPYVALGYWYGPGVRRETFFWGKEPHLTMLYEDEVYDAIADRLGYKDVAHERASTDPDVVAGKRNWSDVYMNALAQVIQRSGDFKGFALDQNGNTWVFTFGEMVVEEHPKTVEVGLSDKVSNIVQLPQELDKMVDMAAKPARDLYNFTTEKLKDYPIKVEKIVPTVARLGTVTHGETEYGLSMRLTGPITAIRAAMSDIVGLQKHQNSVIVFHGQGAPDGRMIRFTFKNDDLKKIEKQLKKAEIHEFNLRFEELKWVFETYIPNELADDEALVDKVLNLYKSKGVDGTLSDTEMRSEMLTREPTDPDTPTDYQTHILKYFGKKKGAERYEQSRKAGVEWAANSYLLYGTEAARAGVKDQDTGKESGLRSQFREPEAEDYGPQAEIAKVPAPVPPEMEEHYNKLLQQFGSKALDLLKKEMIQSTKAKRIKLSDDSDWIAGLIESPEFKRWFKKSVVAAVFVNGVPTVPQIMYHGTTADFDVFERGDIGYHFGSMEAAKMRLEAKGYDTKVGGETVEEEKSGYVYGSSIMPVFLSIQNPLEMPDIGSWHRVDSMMHYLPQSVKDQFTFDQLQALNKILVKSRAKEDLETGLAFNYKNPKWIHLQQEGLQIIREALWELGYDGIKYENKVEDVGHTSYIAFAPEQIKTIYNKGTWSDEYGEVWAALAKKPVTFQSVMELAKPNQGARLVRDALEATGLLNYKDVMERTELIMKPFLDLTPEDLSPQSLKEWAVQYNVTEAEIIRRMTDKEIGFSGLATVYDPMRAVIQLALKMHKDEASLSKTLYHEIYHIMEKWIVPTEVRDQFILAVPNSETRANMFRDYVAKKLQEPVPSKLAQIWDKIIEFLHNLRVALGGMNITHPDQIFDALRKGKYEPHFGLPRMVNKKHNEWISKELLNDLDQIDTDKVLSRILSGSASVHDMEELEPIETAHQRVKDLVEDWMRPSPQEYEFVYPTNVNTKAFEKWFKDSVVATENGDPLMVFHGTNAPDDFSVFKDKLGRAGWFSERPELAGTYAGYIEWSEQMEPGSRIMPVYLSIQNPFTLPFNINASATARYFHKSAGVPGKVEDWYDGPISANMVERPVWQFFKEKSLTEHLKKNGYDGVFAREGEAETWLVFDSTQVKSVFNKGTWSRKHPNISASIADTPWTPDQKLQATEKQDFTVPGIIEMPEIIQIVQLLNQGKIPGVREKLFGRDSIRGVFMPGSGNIKLKADIFRDPALAARVLAHEIGHLIDWLPDHVIKGNILGKIATIRDFIIHTLPYKPGAPGALTPADIARLRDEAIKLLGLTQVLRTKWIDTTITEELKVTPQDILNIWNAVERAKLFSPELYKYIAGLDAHAKKLIAIAAMKGMVPLEVEKFAKTIKGATTRTAVTEVEYIPPTQEQIAKKLAELLEKEIRLRKLWVEEEVRDELKTLSARWRPFDPTQSARFTQYRWSSAELYADAISVLFNDPAFLKSQAPKFYESFFNYLDSKPDVKRVYNEIQREIRSGEVDKIRTERIYEMFDEGNEAYAKQYEDLSPKFSDALKRDFIDTFHFIIKDVKKVGAGNIPANQNPQYKLEEMVYTGSEIEAFLTDLYANVIKPLEKANIKWDREFGLLVFLRRLAIERDKIAAPLGWDAEKAINKMEALKNMELTPGQWTALKTAAAKFRELHESYFIDKAEAAEIYDDELIKLFRDNTAYATFDVLPYLVQRYGHSVATRVYHQIGTLQKISNPATATVMKDISFMKAVNKNTATRAVVKFYKDYASVLGVNIEEAHKAWNGRFHAIQEPKDRTQGLVVYLHKGKAYGYYLPKDIAEAINKNTTKYASVARIFRGLSQPARKIFTELNYGFWIFNAFFRDAQRMVMALPGKRIDKFAWAWLRGLKPAFKSVFGIPDEVVQRMQREHMLISVANVHDMNTEDEQLEKLLTMYHMKPHQVYQNKIMKPFGHLFNWVANRARLAEYYFTATGRALERTTKVGTYKYLKENFPDMPDEVLGHVVRNRGGSPDFLRGGREMSLYNNILLFSNAIKEGYRGDYEAFKENPGDFLLKKLAFVMVPKLLMYAGLMGFLGAAVKEIFDGVTEYDLTNYLIIPLGRTASGKVVYWRVPTDETSRFLGGILMKILRTPELGFAPQATDLFDYMAGQAPTVSPVLSAIYDTVDYASGKNPYDRFYGRHAVGEVEFAAGDRRSHIQFLQYLAGKMGASIVYKFKHDKVEKIAEELESVLGFPINSKVADFVVQAPDAPVVSNILGRFLKVTDYGVREDILRAKEKIKRENARGILDAREAAYAIVEGRDLTNSQLLALAQKPDVVDRAMMLALARKYGMVYFEEWMSAGSTAEKFAVLATMMQKNALSYQDVTGLVSAPPVEKAKPAPAPSQEFPGLNIKDLLEKETRK